MDAPVGHFFDVMTNGYGAMYSYASRVAVGRSVAHRGLHIRALQLSQSAPAAYHGMEAINRGSQNDGQWRPCWRNEVSNHGAETIRIPEIRLGAKAASVERISGVVGGSGCCSALQVFSQIASTFSILLYCLHLLDRIRIRRIVHAVDEPHSGRQVGVPPRAVSSKRRCVHCR